MAQMLMSFCSKLIVPCTRQNETARTGSCTLPRKLAFQFANVSTLKISYGARLSEERSPFTTSRSLISLLDDSSDLKRWRDGSTPLWEVFPRTGLFPLQRRVDLSSRWAHSFSSTPVVKREPGKAFRITPSRSLSMFQQSSSDEQGS